MALHRDLGFGHAVLVQPGAYGADHRALLDTLEKAQGRYRGVMLVEEDDQDIDFAAYHAAGIRGIRFNLVPHLGQPPAPAQVRRLAERIGPLGWHFVVHAGPAELDGLQSYLAFDLPVVIDHMARLDATAGSQQPAMEQLLALLTHPQCWIKLSGIDRVSREGAPFSDAMALARRLAEAAPERCLWGTDFPHPNHAQMPDDADLVDMIALMVPDAKRQQALLVDNPLKLYS